MKHFFTLSIVLLVFFLSCNSQKNNGKDKTDSNIILKYIQQGKDVFLANKKINGIIDFSDIPLSYSQTQKIAIIEINSALTFINCKFSDSIKIFAPKENHAYITHFNKPVTFINCEFSGHFNFRQAVFNNEVIFAQCKFNDEAHFEGVVFNTHNIDFKETSFNAKAKFTSSEFYGNLNFMSSKFYANAEFNNCFFNRNVNFASCDFKKLANFANIETRGYFKANYSIFSDKAYFNNAVFYKEVNFVKISSKKNFVFTKNNCLNKVDFSNAYFDNNLTLKNNIFKTGFTEFNNVEITDSCKTITNDNKIFNFELMEVQFSEN